MNLKELILKLVDDKNHICPRCGTNVQLERNYNNKYSRYILCKNYHINGRYHYYLIPYFRIEENIDVFLFSILDNENYVAYSEFYNSETNDLLKSYIYNKSNYSRFNLSLEDQAKSNILECRLFFEENFPYLTDESLEKLKTINLFY